MCVCVCVTRRAHDRKASALKLQQNLAQGPGPGLVCRVHRQDTCVQLQAYGLQLVDVSNLGISDSTPLGSEQLPEPQAATRRRAGARAREVDQPTQPLVASHHSHLITTSSRDEHDLSITSSPPQHHLGTTTAPPRHHLGTPS